MKPQDPAKLTPAEVLHQVSDLSERTADQLAAVTAVMAAQEAKRRADGAAGATADAKAVVTKLLSGGWALCLFVVAAGGMVGVGFIPRLPGGVAWGLEAAFMIAILAIIGRAVTGSAAGVLVNERNLMSLSRFQIVVWTILLLSAYLTIVFRRMSLPDPLAVAIDARLWALMGISTTTLVGSPLLVLSKKSKELKEGVAQKAADELGEKPKDLEQNASGLLYANPSIESARFTDIFEGDEVANTAYVDLGKVQMFFFTIVAAVSYGVSLFRLIQGTPAVEITSLPELGTGLVAILGISHVGYLGAKTARHTPAAGAAKGTTAVHRGS